MRTYNIFSRGVYEVPVIDKPVILKVEIKNLLLKRIISLCVGTNQNEERQQSRFMEERLKQLAYLFKGERLIFFGQFSYLWNTETNKYITFPEFPLGCFKE